MTSRSVFPEPGMELTHILVVSDLEASTTWYRDVLGAELDRTYGGTSAVFRFNNTWLLLVTSGEPTEDKPGVTMTPPTDQSRISHSFTIRVGDCQDAFEVLNERGAEFLTPPYERGAEIRCFFRDPDSNLFEISEYVG